MLSPRQRAAGPESSLARHRRYTRRHEEGARRPSLYAASETDADILYPTGFFAPDPFLFVQKGRRASS